MSNLPRLLIKRLSCRILLLLACTSFLDATCLAQGPIITTYAGPASTVDGLPAIVQSIDRPVGVTPDGVGGLFVAAGSRVYRVSAAGLLSVVAGSTHGFSGDGGPATSAQLASPKGMAVDRRGNLFIADTFNHRIRKVAVNGIISTVAGTGVAGFSGDGGPARAAQLNYPTDVALDAAGNLYIADLTNSRVRKVSTRDIITTYVGTGRVGFGGDEGPAILATLRAPEGLAIDSLDSLYIADAGNNRIRKVRADGVIYTVAGSGTSGFAGDGNISLAALLSNPTDVAVDSSGNIFVADSLNRRIRKITTDLVISTIAGTGAFDSGPDAGPAISTPIAFPESVAVDGTGVVYVADSPGNRVRKIDTNGLIGTAAGTGTFGYLGEGGSATSALLHYPEGVAVDGSGNLYIADSWNSRIRRVSPAGLISTLAGVGNDGTVPFSRSGPATAVRLYSPARVAVDSSGNVYISDAIVVRKVSAGGALTTVAGADSEGFGGDGGPAAAARFNDLQGIVVDGAGNLYVSDSKNHRVRKISISTDVVATFAGFGGAFFGGDGGPATAAYLNTPAGLALDRSGNLYIADSGNHRIRKVTPGGVIVTIAGKGTAGFSGDGGPATEAQLSSPRGVAIDTAGNIYIADYDNNRIRKVTSSGVISTVAGTGAGGFGGDGGLATLAQLSFPQDVTVDGADNLYIADYYNHRIRKVSDVSSAIPGPVITSSATQPAGFVGITYAEAITGTSGTPPYRWSILGGALPPGLSLDSTPLSGVVSGVPMAAGAYAFTVNLTDSAQAQISKTLQITVSTAVTSMQPAGSLAQVASGSGWKTTIYLTNPSATPVQAEINFLADDGKPLALPISITSRLGAGTVDSAADLVLEPNSIGVIETEAPGNPISVGWIDVLATGPLDGYAVFRNRIAQLPDQEGTGPLDSRRGPFLLFAYDNSEGFQTGVALANQATAATIVMLLFRDEGGAQLGSSSLALPGLGHTSFFLADRFSQASNRRGIVEIHSSAGSITGVGLRFNPTGSFTSVPMTR